MRSLFRETSGVGVYLKTWLQARAERGAANGYAPLDGDGLVPAENLPPGQGGDGAPTTADYLVGTTNAGLSAEIVVGTSPGGELGGTWASPTVDATHSGSTHAATQAAAEATASGALTAHEGAADPHTGYVKENDANWTDLTDSGATTLHSHATASHDIDGAAHNGFPGGTSTFLRADGSFAAPTAAAAISQTEIDFGATPVSEASFVITDAAVSETSNLIGTVAYVASTGKDLDEMDMDALELKFAPGDGEFTIYARGLDGYVADKFKINYQVGA